MHEITRRLWDRDLNVKKWAELNGFSPHTVSAVIRDVRGKWRAGKAKKIREALVNQGFAVPENFNREGKKSQGFATKEDFDKEPGK